MYRVTKQFAFSASHQLTHLPPGHPCARLHGHNYVVELELAAEALDPNGFVLDFKDLDAVKRWIDGTLDHRHLNAVLGDGQLTTSERLAQFIYDEWVTAYPLLVAVRVRETDKTCAEYRP
jgi:6-pyruvoyltetrahydropterin/6-carboxytetrahydropterin synthase